MSLLVPRDRATIQAALLGSENARTAAGGTALDVREGSDAWMRASALAVILEGLEAAAANAMRDILPDQATGGRLNAHGDVIQRPRRTDETDASYQTRQLVWWQERLMASDPAAWVAACEEVSVVDDAFCFVQLAPGSASYFTLGTTVIVARGPAQGDSPVNTRVLSAPQLAHVLAYLEGTEDAAGNPVSDGTQLRPVTARDGNYDVEAIQEDAQPVRIQIVNAPSSAFPWSGTVAITGSTTSTIEVLGDRTDLANLEALAAIGTSVYRGSYHRTNLGAAVFDGVHTTFTLTAALDAAPSGDLYPCPANWESIRARVLALFDALGPGDAVPLSLIDPSRFPSEEATAPGTLSLAALYVAVGNAQDVLAVTPLTPSADVIPDPMHQVTLAKFWIEEAP